MNYNDTDTIFLDYFSELLLSDEAGHDVASKASQDFLLILKPQACLQVKLGE